MAKTKQTIARFIDEYETYLKKVDASIGAIEQEHARWVKDQREFKEAWAGKPVVALLKGQHSLEAWTKALEDTDVPALQKIRIEAEDSIAQLHESQQLIRKTIQHCLVRQPELEARLVQVDASLGQHHEALEEKKSKLERIQKEQERNNDHWVEHLARNWKFQSQRERPPTVYDYDAPQPWWAQPWILSVINPSMKRNMADAQKFKDKTGLSLFAVAQGYARRVDEHTQASVEYSDAKTQYSRMEKLHNELVEARMTNENTLARSERQLLPATGPGSIADHEDNVRQTALDSAIRHCIMNNINKVGQLHLVLPDAKLAAQRSGKLAAMQQVAQSIENTVQDYNRGRAAVQKDVDYMHVLAKTHTRHGQITVDTSARRNMISSIEDDAKNLRARLTHARAVMRRPTPFASSPSGQPSHASSFSSSPSSSTSSSTSSNDSMFWTMAWIYLLSSSGPAHAAPTGVIEPDANGLPTLDADKFQQEFDNANGGLGLSSQLSIESPFVDTELSRSHDGGASIASSGSSATIDVSPMQVEVISGGGSSWNTSQVYSTTESVSSSSTSSHTSSEPSVSYSSPGASCGGSSCGGGGGGGD